MSGTGWGWRVGGCPDRISSAGWAGELRFLVSAEDGRTLSSALLHGASQRLGKRIGHLRDLGHDTVLSLSPEEQYLVATGRTYFRDLPFDKLRRMQFDLETTGLSPRAAASS